MSALEVAQPVVEAAPSPIEGLEGTSASGTAEAVPIDSFSLDGLETTSLSAESAPLAAAPLADLDFGPAGSPGGGQLAATEPPATVDLDFGTPPVSEPVPPTVEVPALEFASDEAPAAVQPAAAADGAPLDLELSLPEAPASQQVPEVIAPPVPEVAEQGVESETPAAPEPPSPFLTETMAELYLQQGHREEALRVYRALLAQRPGDATLAGRIAALESPTGQWGGPPQPVAARQGPAMRDLLQAIAARRPGFRPEWPGSNGTAAASTAAGTRSPEYETPVPADTSRTDALATALGFAQPRPPAEAAALVLAGAFGSNGNADALPLLTGAAARPAADELTLGTVFRSDDAPPPSSFSFDQFFSARASTEQAVPPASAGGGQGAESPEEVAHFTQWLEGLKGR